MGTVFCPSWKPLVNIRRTQRFRFPVQYVLMPQPRLSRLGNHVWFDSCRGSNRSMFIRKGSIVEAIDTYSGPLEEAHAPLSVTIRLKDELDISRGDLLVQDIHNIEHAQKMEAILVWMSEAPLDPSRSYWIKHCTQYVHANIDALFLKLDMQTLDKNTPDLVALNELRVLK